MVTRFKSGIFKPKIYLSHKELQGVKNLPTNTENALASEVWRRAMEEEYKTLMNNNTRELVEPDTNMKVIGNK